MPLLPPTFIPDEKVGDVLHKVSTLRGQTRDIEDAAILGCPGVWSHAVFYNKQKYENLRFRISLGSRIFPYQHKKHNM